ncbi:TBC1 domain family member 16 [Planococcus citri]|uniref:TBC1 domain family member 16 n=1 Tax=Planococcus citri TaxID=170843 RepID=UPI0031F8C539
MDHILSNVIKKAAVLFHQKPQQRSFDSYGDEDIVFSKNNVCVHSIASNRTTVHHPGYLTLSYKCNKSSKKNEVDNFTLQLTWIPNYIFKNNKNSKKSTSSTLKRSNNFDDNEHGSNKDNCTPIRDENEIEFENHSDNNLFVSNSTNNNMEHFDKKRKLINRFRMSFSEEQSDNEEYDDFNENDYCYSNEKDDIKSYSKFSIDLGQMKCVRIFFAENSEKSGQLVITSKENQYKILHFHHGGLEKLQDILQQWNSFVSDSISMKDEKMVYKHFTISGPPNKNVKSAAKNQFPKMSVKMWNGLMNESGQIEDETLFRKAVFFGGLHKNLRKIVWPFLLNCYSLESTIQERNDMKIIREEKYKIVNEIKNDILNAADDSFFKQLEYLIYKDVIRTDRSHSFYTGDENPNLKTMQNILLNYAVLYNDYGYSQGMSDLLAPILSELQNEAEAFWCFVCLMKRCLFVCTPTDTDMEKNLEYLRELIRIMHTSFYEYLNTQQNGMDLLFCHRWLLLCFKREFPFDMALQIWETCWSNYLTNYFHLFISLAIIVTYSEDVMKQKLNSDDMLFYFSSLAMRMDGQAILAKARELLDSFRSLSEIPSTLSCLCQTSNSDIWDNSTILVLKKHA